MPACQLPLSAPDRHVPRIVLHDKGHAKIVGDAHCNLLHGLQEIIVAEHAYDLANAAGAAMRVRRICQRRADAAPSSGIIL
jgi:hypothetical protein